MHRTRAQAGRYAQAKGMTFEEEIKRANDKLFHGDLGRVVHMHAASKQRNGQMLWQGKGPFDWVGMLRPGIPVFFESKERDFRQRSMPTKYTLPERDEHQLIELRHFERFGGEKSLAFILFNWRLIDEDGAIVDAEMRLHPIQTIPKRTILREQGLIAQNRNWYEAALSRDYGECASTGFVQYADDSLIAV